MAGYSRCADYARSGILPEMITLQQLMNQAH
jgi:hypothetical protein